MVEYESFQLHHLAMVLHMALCKFETGVIYYIPPNIFYYNPTLHSLVTTLQHGRAFQEQNLVRNHFSSTYYLLCLR